MSDSLRERWRRWSTSPALIGFTRRRVALQWRMRGRPLPPPHVVKQLAILQYQRSRRFTTFVETGTFTGEMVDAMRSHFHRVISIEMSPEIHTNAVRRFAGDPRIELLLGDSAIVLPRVLQQIRDPALFWLDGHFMGGHTARSHDDSPVRHELTSLLAHRVRGHVVLIDDARLFDGSAGYPTLSELRSWIARERPGSDVEIEDDIIRCTFDSTNAVS
ncbi:MAG TPA: hypothetical protein VFT39_14420 [Vicinamibacterales bacterium]|nr:hypothetical protein [Vicinamibacterales bacterium]